MKTMILPLMILMTITQALATELTDEVKSIRGLLGCYETSDSLKMIITTNDSKLPVEARCEANGVGHCQRDVVIYDADGYKVRSFKGSAIAQNPAIGSAFLFPIELSANYFPLRIERVSYGTEMSIEAFEMVEYRMSSLGPLMSFSRCK